MEDGYAAYARQDRLARRPKRFQRFSNSGTQRWIQRMIVVRVAVSFVRRSNDVDPGGRAILTFASYAVGTRRRQTAAFPSSFFTIRYVPAERAKPCLASVPYAPTPYRGPCRRRS
jgi:hypothetical protein